MGLGLAFLSFYVFLLGALGLVYKNVLTLSMGAFLLAGIGGLKDFLADLRRIKDGFTATLADNGSRFYWAVLLLAAGANFFYNYTPPSQGREMLYNLYLPKLLLSQHHILKAADEPNLTLYYPVLFERLYALAMGLRGDMVAKLIHYACGIASALFVYELVKRFVSAGPALLAATIVYLMPLISSVSGTANVELGTLFYSVATAYGLLLWLEKDSGWKEAALAGLMAGLSWHAKISGISMVPAGLVFIFAMKPKPSTFRPALIFSFFAFIGISPWAVNNWVSFGDPVYPFPVGLLGMRGHEYAAMAIDYLKTRTPDHSALETIKLSNNIFLGDVLFGPGPLVFPFLLPGLVLDRQRNVKAVALLGSLFFLFHYLTFNSDFHRFGDTRFYLPAYALWAVAAAVGIERLKESMRWASMARGAVILGLLFPCLLLSLVFGATKLPVFLGLETKETYLRKKLPNYDLFDFANSRLPGGSKVLVLGNGDPHWYYWDAPAVWAPLDLIKKRDRGEILPALKEMGVTHVLFMFSSLRYDAASKIYRDPEIPGLDIHWDMERLEKRDLKALFKNERSVLFELVRP
ncbi:MAG: hypothetical protein A3A86_02555 [Elusimicrobia bacterium RIFCSPLOWO2_01_FULL_60_11]|nr:MAG: hypothetical protein A3A86_02555 [Elusimicrobia bacterium RIFCSPLOWO2_01_FULL_60_11]